jgi:septal ring-binding cell division protein DamX
MSISLNITVDTSEELYATLQQLASGASAAPSAPAPVAQDAPAAKPEAAPKKPRAAKPEAAEPEAVVEEAPEPAPEPETKAARTDVPDFDRDVTPKLLAAVKDKGKDFVVGVLEQFGVAKASEIPQDMLGEFIDALEG